jgi:hypothetical protein
MTDNSNYKSIMGISKIKKFEIKRKIVNCKIVNSKYIKIVNIL